MGDPKVDLNIRRPYGSTLPVRTRLESKVAEFKASLSMNYGVDAAEDQLLFRNRFFEDHLPLSYYGLEGGDTVHILPADGVVEGGAGAVTYADLDAAFVGTEGLAGFEKVHQELAQNPNMNRDPLYLHIVEILLNHPLVRMRIMGNAQKDAIADQIARAARVYANPSIRRHVLDAMRDLELRDQLPNTLRLEMGDAENSYDFFFQKEVDLNIRSNGSTYFVPTRLDLTVAEFKGFLSMDYGVNAFENWIMIRNGQFFEDHQTLSYYGLEASHTVHILPVDDGHGGLSSYTSIDSAFRGTKGIPGFEEVHRLLAQNPNMIRDRLYPHIVEIILHFPQIRRHIMDNTLIYEVADQIDRAARVYADRRIRQQIREATRNPEYMPQFTKNMIEEMRNKGVYMLY